MAVPPDRMLRLFAKRIAPFFLALAFVSSVHAEKITLTGHFPARNPEASQLRRLSVSRFDGNGGAAVTSAIESQLAAGDGGAGPWFTIVSGMPARGRMARSEGFVAGSAQGGVSDTPVQRQTFQCLEMAGKRCVRYATIACTIRVVSLSVDARITRASDNRIVYSATKPMREQMDWCEGQTPPKTADEALIEIALAVARDIKRDISPYDENYEVKVRESTDGMPKTAKDRFKGAVKLSVRDLQGSCGVWDGLKAEAPQSPALIFDLGLCAEAKGDFAAAASYYQQSQALVPNGSKDAAEGLSRVRLLLAAREQAQQQQSRRQQAETETARQQAEADRTAQRQAAAATRAERVAQAAAKRRASVQAAAERSAHENERQQVASRYGAGAADAIVARRVEKGMTPAQVRAAIGGPTRIERIGPGEEQWLYAGRRVVFSSGRVSYVSN